MHLIDEAMTESEARFSHPKCYASKLNNCSPKITREHFVSHGILRAIAASGPVLTKGLRWQPASEEQFIPTNRLASNILCENHNFQLSDLDNEATRLFTFLQDFQKGDTGIPSKEDGIEIDGSLIERWLLKTLCGFLASNNSPTEEPEIHSKWKPENWWIDILFGRTPMPEPFGLYFFGGVPPQTPTNDYSSGVQYQPLMEQGLGVYGAILSLYTPRFLLSMALPPKKLVGTFLEHATRHPSNLILSDEHLIHKVSFRWSPNEAGQSINIMIRR